MRTEDEWTLERYRLDVALTELGQRLGRSALVPTTRAMHAVQALVDEWHGMGRAHRAWRRFILRDVTCAKCRATEQFRDSEAFRDLGHEGREV